MTSSMARLKPSATTLRRRHTRPADVFERGQQAPLKNEPRGTFAQAFWRPESAVRHLVSISLGDHVRGVGAAARTTPSPSRPGA